MTKSIVLSVISTQKSNTLKYHAFFNKAWVFSIICDKCGNNDKKCLKKKNQ